ncbi:MAG: DUF1501 domain-containing protein [Pirellulales bacterium]
MHDRQAQGCSGFRQSLASSRREFLKAGSIGLLGLGSAQLLRAEANDKPRARSVILVYCFGGPSHLDMWDMKPDGPSAIRGEFSPIRTRLPGSVYCEHLPRLAERNDRFTLIRSVTHDRLVHGGAVGFVLTGTRTADPGIPGVRGPDASLDDHPALGAMVNRSAPSVQPVPSAITLPWEMIDGQGRLVPGQGAAMLGRQYDPWLVRSDPNNPKFSVGGLELEPGLSIGSLDRRRRLRDSVNSQSRRLEQVAEMQVLDAYYQRAFGLLTSQRTELAFDLKREPAALRDRYGRNTFGQSCLLARRLVEAGVRLVQVNMGNDLNGEYGWDTHADNFNRLKQKLLPKFDPGFSALLDDLDERGLLADTLVVCMGEFGRTPRISKNAGREHWPHCYSVLLAGAGVQRGLEYGASDNQGAYPIDCPVTPEDLVATIYDWLAIDPGSTITDHLGREHALVKGRVLAELWS